MKMILEIDDERVAISRTRQGDVEVRTGPGFSAPGTEEGFYISPDVAMLLSVALRIAATCDD